jgi:mannose-6-phosphate isomerase-like protein (cupin superfamily)
LAAETEVKQMWPIKYVAPESLDRPKITVNLGNTDLLRVGVQVVEPKGGETNMHAHSGLDSCWLVLSGKARFYGYGDTLIAEAGQHEGVFIPKGVPYWFEAAGEERLEILHITALDRDFKNDRVDYAPPRERQAGMEGRGRPPTDEERQAAVASVASS